MQFVVLWSSKGKASDPQRSRKAKGAGMVIKIQCGEEDGDAQNGSVQLQRVLLALCTVEGLIYCWFIPLWVAFALTGSQLPNLLGKVQGAVGGKVEPISAAGMLWGWVLLLFSRGSGAPVWSVPCHGQQLHSVLLPSPLLLLALHLKTNLHWSLGINKKKKVWWIKRHSSIF